MKWSEATTAVLSALCEEHSVVYLHGLPHLLVAFRTLKAKPLVPHFDAAMEVTGAVAAPAVDHAFEWAEAYRAYDVAVDDGVVAG